MMLKEFESDGSENAPDWTDLPWRLVFPGLSEARANRILGLTEEAGVAYGGYATGPTWNLSLGLDRVTAQWLRAALAEEDSLVINESGEAMEMVTPALARERMEAVVEYLDEFLRHGDRYPVEE